MRTYLVVIDDSPESRVALRFAARRAAKTSGAVALVALVEPAEFVQWGAVQAAMEEEAELRVQTMVAEIAGSIFAEVGMRPSILVSDGDPIETVTAALTSVENVAALVLGAAATGWPGELVEHFAGPGVGQLPCPVMLIPGGLDDDALDRLS